MTQDKGAVMSLLSFGAANWMSNSATVSLLYCKGCEVLEAAVVELLLKETADVASRSKISM